MAWSRNQHGMKNTVDRVRRFNGAEYIGWMAHADGKLLDEYRAAGIRCRRVGGDVFIHHMDEDDARALDRAANR